MSARDARVDAYIAKSAAFAQPILAHLRDIVHAASPEIEETIKWGMPFFTWKGPLCAMAAFKQHCTFSFWKGGLVVDAAHGEAGEAMGQFGRLTGVKDLPAKKTLIAYVRKAMALNEAGVTPPSRSRAAPKPEAKLPDDFAAALSKKKSVRAAFDAMRPSHRREYVEWIEEAKRDDTRARRIATAVEWIAEGKSRNWKYERC